MDRMGSSRNDQHLNYHVHHHKHYHKHKYIHKHVYLDKYYYIHDHKHHYHHDLGPQRWEDCKAEARRLALFPAPQCPI